MDLEPIKLNVVEQQAPDHALSIDVKAQKRGRVVLLCMFLFFVLPLVVVLAMHQYGWHPQGDSLGELIQPARALQMSPRLQDAKGRLVTIEMLKDKWSMVYIAETCDHTCAERLYSMRQLHVALAKDIDRVQRVWITSSQDVAAIQTQYPDMLIINQPSDALASLTAQFEIVGQDVQHSGQIYLVDPLANLMMRYPKTTHPREIYKDITRLLKYAWAG